MKLRLQFNSIRLRLKQSEVAQFAQTGRVVEKIIFGTADGETFHYVLAATDTVSSPQATVTASGIVVQVPVPAALRWVYTDQVGIEGEQPVIGQVNLRILIEKDFACVDGTEEQNADTFPNPLAGTKC
jgi:hypothetical protein